MWSKLGSRISTFQLWVQFSNKIFSYTVTAHAGLIVDGNATTSSVHGILQARILEWVAIPFSRGVFLTQGSNPGLLQCRQILHHLSHQGSPKLLGI